MAYLYKNTNGYEVRSHSHSGGQDWSCPKRYYWKRLEGWQSKEDGAGMVFGRAIEDSVRYFHARNFDSGSGVDEFKKIWFSQKDEPIVYTEKSGDWDAHYKMGSEMMALYELSITELPISNALFQQEYKPLLFTEGPYEGLRFKAIVDMLCTAPADHPLLPQIGLKGMVNFVVDIKTSANSYYTDPRLSSLDGQLRDYAWVTGLNIVSFLVLVKNNSSITTGDWVTLLTGDKAGKKYQVFYDGDSGLAVLTKQLYDEYQDRSKQIKGKGAKEKKEILYTEYFYRAVKVNRNDVTKQRIQFLPAFISDEDAQEAKREAIHEAMDIADHGREAYYPKHPGVRFPNNVCGVCDCLGLCLGDKQMVSEKLVQIGGTF